MGGKFGVVSFLQIVAPELSDRMLADFMDAENGIIVNLHIQSIDHNEAIKTIKRKITDLDRMKIEEQKKQSAAATTWILFRPTLPPTAGSKKPTPRFAEPQRKNVSAYAACLKPCRYQAEIG